MQAETSRIDELLECLVFLTRFYGVPNSQDALTTGLPPGLRTPDNRTLLPCCRAGRVIRP